MGSILEFQIQNLRIRTRFKGPQKADDTVLCHNNLLHRNIYGPKSTNGKIFFLLSLKCNVCSQLALHNHTPKSIRELHTRHWFSPTPSHDSQRPVSLRGASSMTVGPSDRELVHRKAHPTLWLVKLGGHVVSWVGPT